MLPAEQIKKAFDVYFDVPLEKWNDFTELGEVITVSKNEIIKSNGRTEKYLYFILKGSGGVLLWNKNNFICIDLCFENDFFGDYMSFLTSQPSQIEVVTFEESTLFRISKSNFDKLSNGTDYGDKICRFAAEALFVHKQQQQIDILTKLADERYAELMKRNLSVIQRTPQKYIASYLGITPQSLSRIRSKS